MNLKNILIISAVILLLSLTAVSAADINDANATNSIAHDTHSISALENTKIKNLNATSSTGTFDDLQVEINNAPAGSVLNLTRDYNGHYGSRIQFNKDLTIDGRGHTLDCLGEKGCSAFYSNSGTIVLKNLKIINGHNDYNDKGGAIHTDGSAQYVLENCIFDHNWADDYGGAIYNGVNKPLTIINCQFNNNGVSDWDGGAIYSVGELKIINSTFLFNYACVNGGAISCERDVTVSGCYFGTNTATGADFYQCHGGAIYSKNNVYADNSQFEGNIAYDYGGAISANNVYVNQKQNISNSFTSDFIGNFVYDDNGGAIYANNLITACNTEFRKNKANKDGGALFAETNVKVTHCEFDNNKATGAICPSDGGAIHSNTIDIDNSTFTENYADNLGGAIWAKTLNINTKQTVPAFSSFFFSNTAKKGGAAFVSKGNIVNTKFCYNQASQIGGAILIENCEVKHCYFYDNKESSEGVDYGGGAIKSDNLTVTNSTFDCNHAKSKGGAIKCENLLKIDSNTYFIYNTAEVEGGAIYTQKFKNDLKQVTFIGNSAGDDGGAIYINNLVETLF